MTDRIHSNINIISWYVPHKAAAEVSKVGLQGRFIAVNDGCQSEPTDGPTSGCWQRSVVEVVAVLVADM